MRFHPAKICIVFSCIFFTSLFLTISCSKDSDILVDSVISESEASVSIQDQTATETENTETEVEVTEEEVSSEPTLVLRTTSFSPLHDAHVQSGRGYNQNIIRLEENSRTSYLMFDLSEIGEISGNIKEVDLQFTIDSDDGSGTVKVFKGDSSTWTESTLSDESAPEAVTQIGSIAKEFIIGETQTIELDASGISAEVKTLVLQHQDGNDFAFASKEHTTKTGPKLVVSYEVEESAEEIVDVTPIDEETTDDSSNEDTPEESIASEDTDGNQEPMAIADASPSSGGVPLEVSFLGSNSSDDSQIASYNWNFKDGATSTEPDPTHTFDESGVYEVELTITDDEGLRTTDIVKITVTEGANEAPVSIVSATPVTGEAPLQVNFTGSESTDDHGISKYGWDFKDGSKTNIADFTYTYDEPGTYEAELTVTDENGLTDNATITITVTEPSNDAPTAVATANPTTGNAPLDVQFIGDKSTDDKGISSYYWNFKDGTNASSANPSHKFNTPGNYAVELTVKDEAGLESKKTVQITVLENSNNAPTAVATASPSSGQAPLSVQFIGNNSSDDNGITSYYWDFKDGSTASSNNPSHTFNNAGVYNVSLTVKDSEGLTSTKQVTITVESNDSNNGGGSAEPGYYVATNGSSSNNGKSPSSPWSIEHAFAVAKAGDVVYIKAGDYGSKQLITKNQGNSSNHIKFIGYKSSPGDINSNNGSTFNYGESVQAWKMPLLRSSSTSATAITIHDPYIDIENIQVTGYGFGVQVISLGKNVTLKNVIVTKVGNQSSSGSYTGVGFKIEGSNALLEDCFVLNAGAEAFNLSNSDYSKVDYCKAYADNNGNPTDYYFLLTGGTNNTIVQNSYADRARFLDHGGHGFDMKDLAENNTFKNCTAKRTNIELNFTGVKYNKIVDCYIYGASTQTSDWQAVLAVFNGANNNTIENVYIQDTYRAIHWGDYDDQFVGPGGDRDAVSMGYDNTFKSITVKNTERILNVGGGTSYNAKASRNKFINCDFSNFNDAVVTYYRTEDISFTNCKFSNGEKLVKETQGAYSSYSKFNVSWINCTWVNVGFNPPN